MPELPEVETVKRTLNELVIGKTVEHVEIRWPKIIRRPQDAGEFARLMAGETLHHVGRRGKFLLFCFDSKVLVSHLRMEGRYRLDRENVPVDPYTHVIFHFTDDTSLRYRDVRKFGTMHLFRKGEEWRMLPLKELGPEPFSNSFSAESLALSCRKTTRAVKPMLLDQRAVVGLGNIYTDEALFRARIHPLTPAADLTMPQIKTLHEAIVETLGEAVKMGGSTIRTFVNSRGHAGFFQQKLQVYGRKGMPCPRCGTAIEKIKVGGRGTHFCPACQIRVTGS
ncbi:DNA-formamidopyrimidine glycosylase [Sporolactobacillus sp. CQH2019]|uniref:DNA-formamidopyrimidine glycosylase n=1 Tax=Sporolactobacillus sp. CQH2019 TaxID=3023512 RepID=UPI002367A2C0|nr:DNA-formamidopyrimidine glycosylase [Sporolactobacillus sp. CQH2019]MDD9147895.1 DNA-formamidopyrimidine glycosylase [Sporolactobacillus sp. CQH2019]